MPGYRGVNDAIAEGCQYLLKSHDIVQSRLVWKIS